MSSHASKRPLSSLPLAPSMLAKLLNAGFEYRNEICDMTTLQLSQELSITPSEALQVIRAVQGSQNNANQRNLPTEDMSSKGTHGSRIQASMHAQSSSYESKSSPPPSGASVLAGKSALELLNKKRSQRPIFTLNRQLDTMLGGGVARGEVTEFCGVPGMGKTQLGIQLSCDVQIPEAFGGAGGAAVYIDTEGSFMPERVAEIANGLISHMHAVTSSRPPQSDLRRLALEMNVEKLMRNIHVFRVYDYVEQIACVKSLTAFLSLHPEIRLLVMDSVAFHFRRDFEDMALRARLLTGMAQDLLSLAENFDLAVVLTNQVTTKIRNYSSHLVPALGESWAHACTNRVMLHWRDQERTATLVKSPSQRDMSVPYGITQEGIRSVEAIDRSTERGVTTNTITESGAGAGAGTAYDNDGVAAKRKAPEEHGHAQPSTTETDASMSKYARKQH